MLKEDIMENSIKRKINIFGKVGKIITTVIIVLLLVAEGAMLAGTIALAIIPHDAVTADVEAKANVKIDADYFNMKDGEIKIPGKVTVFSTKLDPRFEVKNGTAEFNAETGNLHFDLADVIKLLAVGMVKLAAVIVALYFFKALMKAFRCCDSPFDDNVIKKMRAFAIALIPTMVVSSAANGVLGGLFTGKFSFGSVELLPVAFAFIIFVLTAIFRYGAMLQKEHDETV